MPGFSPLPLRLGVVAGLLLTAATGAVSAEERVGVNSAVNPDATGTPPGAAPRRLVIGQDLIFNERITTTASGQTQLLFLDESSMTIGPNSDLTIDQFVYDPKTGTGKLAMSATRGLMRYVGGKLSKNEDAVTLRTGTATLAVRGGAFLAQFDLDKTDVAFLYGKSLTVTGAVGDPQILKRPGFESTALKGGAASHPKPVPPGRLAQYTLQLDGRSGSTGGATVIPTDAKVADSGLPRTISGNLPGSIQQAQNRGGSALTPTDPGSVPTTVEHVQQQSQTVAGAAPVIASVLTGSATGTQQVGTTSSGQPVGGQNSISGSPPPPAPLPFSTPLADLNNLIKTRFNATYLGSASGSVDNNGVKYTAAGGFSMIYNFGTGFGTWTVSSFDGGHIFTSSGTTSLHNTANYSFSIVQRGVAGLVSGTFFGPMAVETGGSFSLHTTIGSPYRVSGIFTGKQ